MKRRNFIRSGVAAGLGASVACANSPSPGTIGPGGPRVISTWNFGLAANAVAMEVLGSGGSCLDAAERGVQVSEADPAITSVGYGGWPNADGVVELDAAIMDGDRLEAGAVASVQRIKHPIAVARKVMDETPHVLLVGDGARRFAVDAGFPEEDLLTDSAREAWEREGRKAAVPAGHDTIGMLTLDAAGHMAAACTTSGLAWKLPGRVGDSPLIGHGLYCDSKVGGASATGVGEEVIKVCGSYQVVEFMRQGVEPDEAVRRVLRRVLDRWESTDRRQHDPSRGDRFIGFVALRSDGQVGYASTTPGFEVAVSGAGQHEIVAAPHLLS